MKIETDKKDKQLIWILLGIVTSGIPAYFTYKGYLEIKDLITVIALVAGPIVAVIITRYNDQTKAKKDRQLMTFRSLMQNRSDPLSKEFVAALNLIEVDFNEYLSIKNAWKELFDALHPKIKPEKPEEQQTQKFLLWTLTTKLLHEIGKCLHIEIEQLDVMQRIYAPQGWLDEKNRREFILNNINSILAKFSQPRSQVELYNLINDKDPALIDLLYDLLKSTKDNPPIN